MSVRQNGEYALGSANEKQNISISGNDWNISISHQTNTLGISITFGQVYAIENNSVCGINVDIDLMFT